jgi:predicted ATPase
MGDDEPEQCIGDPSTSDPATRSPSGASLGELGVASSGSRDVQTAKGDQLPTCYFSVGTEHDDGYSDNDDESIADRLDFTRLKVQGREEQIDRLLKMYSFVQRRGLGRRMNIQKGQTSVAIVSGTSGTGKSTLVKHFVDRLRMQSAQPGRPCMPFFIEGKYEELAGADPFSGLVDAFNGFAQELMEGDADEITRIRDCIRGQLGSEATTLTAVIPGLKAVIQDETAVTGSRENARNKLKYIFQTFVSAISTKQRPVIMFLDDLQWCDSASLDLIVALLTDLDMRYFMFIGSYRADEVGQNDALHQCLEVVNNIQPLERIELTNLSKDKLNLMVLDALQRDEASETMELTEVIYKWTMGNIFHSVQILEELQRKRILSFSRLTFQWEWELKGAELENVLSDDVIQVVTGKISDAHPDLQRILVLAAYTRMGVDVDTLAHLTIINGPPLSPDHLIKMLDKAVVEGLLTNNVGSRFYSFGHDRIQEAGKLQFEGKTYRPCIMSSRSAQSQVANRNSIWDDSAG